MKTIIPLEIIDLQGDGYHLSLQAYMNGKPMRLILDTGASRTVFDINRIHHFVENPGFEINEQLSTGLGTNSMESNIIQIESFVLGDLEITNYSAVIIDMVHINQTYEMIHLPLIDGVLGGDILMEYKVKIDYKTKTISFWFPKKKMFLLSKE